MSLKNRMKASLTGHALTVALPAMVFVGGIEFWLGREEALDAANAAYDRSLLSVIRAIAMDSSSASADLSARHVARLFHPFRMSDRDEIHFNVRTADGLVQAGAADLPQPAVRPMVGVPRFYDAIYLGKPVRVGLCTWISDIPAGTGRVQEVVVLVAQTVEARDAFTHRSMQRAMARSALIIGVMGASLALLLMHLRRSLDKLAQQIASGNADGLKPLETSDSPQELKPLAEAVNERLNRARTSMEQQRRFLDDASHQLRTPLATLHAQVGYALRQGPTGELAHALRSIELQLENATRQTNQLLALARADAISLTHDRFDLAELMREIARWLLPLATAKTLDFGVEISVAPFMCTGDRHLLGEAMSNLAHNAITYANHGGKVTLMAWPAARGFTFAVVNTGSPIPEFILRRAGQRFLKGSQGCGAGLGLAIAKSIVERHGGELTLRVDSTEGTNIALLWWPGVDETGEK